MKTDDFRTNDLKEEELFRAKILCLCSLSLFTNVVFRNETFYSNFCVDELVACAAVATRFLATLRSTPYRGTLIYVVVACLRKSKIQT